MYIFAYVHINDKFITIHHLFLGDIFDLEFGSAVLFHSEVMHAVTPVISGKRNVFSIEFWPVSARIHIHTSISTNIYIYIHTRTRRKYE